MQELIQDLEGATICTKCNFHSPDGKTLVLHNVTKHDGTSLDKILQDASCVSSKRAEVEARGHRQSLGPLCPICDQQMHKSHGKQHNQISISTLMSVCSSVFPFVSWQG